MLQEFETVRTTVTLPANLVKRSQHFVESGIVSNRNTLIVAALEQFLNDLERQEIDRQFAALATDDQQNQLDQQLADAFADSDWEALTAEETA